MEDNLAVLIDFENIAAGTEKEGLGRFDIDALMARAKDKGRILVARSYADWGRFARFKQSLLANNVTMYELTSHGMQDKNRADIAMVVDCLELAFTREYVDTFIVVSGDSDFTPLVLKLRELRKRVIGIGTRRSTSRLLINACDEFIFYDSIVQKKQRPPRRRRSKPSSLSKDLSKAIEFLVDVVEGLMREDPSPPLASIVKTAMLRRRPDFSETDLGFSSFTRFLEAARDEGEITLERDKKSGTYAVDTVDEPDEDEPSAAEPSKDKTSSRRDGPYDDPYIPEGAMRWVDALHRAGVGPLAFPTRMAVLEQLVALLEERNSKRQRTTAPIVADQLAKRLRRTHPELDKAYLEAFLKGMREADLLMHSDGKPIRRASASFGVDKDAPALNKALVEAYLDRLSRAGEDLSDAPRLAELMLGTADRAREIEEMVAWLAAEGAVGDDGQESVPGQDLDDLDAVLSLDEDEQDASSDDEEAEAPKKRPSRSRSKKKTDEAPAEAEEPTEGEAKADGHADDAPAEKPKRKRAPRSRKKKADEAPAEPAAD